MPPIARAAALRRARIFLTSSSLGLKRSWIHCMMRYMSVMSAKKPSTRLLKFWIEISNVLFASVKLPAQLFLIPPIQSAIVLAPFLIGSSRLAVLRTWSSFGLPYGLVNGLNRSNEAYAFERLSPKNTINEDSLILCMKIAASYDVTMLRCYHKNIEA